MLPVFLGSISKEQIFTSYSSTFGQTVVLNWYPTFLHCYSQTRLCFCFNFFFFLNSLCNFLHRRRIRCGGYLHWQSFRLPSGQSSQPDSASGRICVCWSGKQAQCQPHRDPGPWQTGLPAQQQARHKPLNPTRSI